MLSVVAAAALMATAVLARWTPPWRPETTFVASTLLSLKLTAGAIGSAAAGVVLEHSMAGALILAAGAQVFVLATD